MKKNIAMRVAAILFILTMISTCAFSTTFAKYVTTNSASDSARVAKFGVTVTASLSDLYEDGYTTVSTPDNDSTTATVFAAANTNILAPGTYDEQVNALTISGQPEVAVKLDYTCDVTLTGWKVDGVDYCPLVINITVDPIGPVAASTTTFKMDGYTSVSGMAAAIEEHITSLSAVRVDPLTDLGTSISISWSWAYDGDDVKDTKLGDAAVNGDIVFGFSLGCTVTQID